MEKGFNRLREERVVGIRRIYAHNGIWCIGKNYFSNIEYSTIVEQLLRLNTFKTKT